MASVKLLLSTRHSPSVISNALSLLCYTVGEVPVAPHTCRGLLTDGMGGVTSFLCIKEVNCSRRGNRHV